jgi:hypothetical protein
MTQAILIDEMGINWDLRTWNVKISLDRPLVDDMSSK